MSVVRERKTHQVLSLNYGGTQIKVIENFLDAYNPYKIYLLDGYWSMKDGRWHNRKRLIDEYGDFQSVMNRLAQMEWK